MLDMLVRGGFVGTGNEVRDADKTKGEKDVIWEKGYVVYVEYAGVVEHGEERSEWVKEIVERRRLEFVGLRAEDVFDPELSRRLGGPGNMGEALLVDLKDARELTRFCGKALLIFVQLYRSPLPHRPRQHIWKS